MTTHADLLRRAATLARETANAATGGAWAIWDDLPDHGYTTVGDEQGVLTDERPFAEECNPVAHVYARHDAAHTALWHPGVAHHVAAMLDCAASLPERDRDWIAQDRCGNCGTPHLVDIAQALLGEPRA